MDRKTKRKDWEAWLKTLSEDQVRCLLEHFRKEGQR